MTQTNNNYLVLEYQKLMLAWLANVAKAKEALNANNFPEYKRQIRLAHSKRKKMDTMLDDVENSIYY